MLLQTQRRLASSSVNATRRSIKLAAVSAHPASTTTVDAAQQRERAKAAILGACVADAASMGLHWQYDQAVLETLLKDAKRTATPEFFPPINKFYTHPDGAFSPYGFELFGMLKYIAANKDGGLKGDDLAKFLATWYSSLPPGTYLNKSSKAVVANVEAGKKWPDTGMAEDAQANAFVKMPVVVARYFGTPELTKAVEVSVKSQQNNDKAMAAGRIGAQLLERVIMGSTIDEAVAWLLQQPGAVGEDARQVLQEVLPRKSLGVSENAKVLGMSCGLPSSAQVSVLTAASGMSYVEAVRANIIAGGDNASRASLIGGLLAAQDGLSAIPAEWRAKTAHYAEAEKLAEQVLAHRG